ncbi:MAG: histidine kinase [Marinoscillum sp.]
MTRHLLHFVMGFIMGSMAFVYLTYSQPTWTERSELIVFAGILGVIISYIIAFTSNQIGQGIRWKENPGLSLLISLAANFVLISGLLGGFMYFSQSVYQDSIEELTQSDFTKVGILSFLAMLIYCIIYFAYRSFRYFQSASLDNIQLETRQIDLQLMALKAQLSPHFLFNSLNTISSLIYERQDLAEPYIRNLAQVYQYTLPSYDRKLVSFEEEWQYVKANNDLLKTRFGENLSIILEDEAKLYEVNLPPLTLQLLVENVMKHNQIDEENKVSITLKNEGKWWSVTNNKTRAPANVFSFKIGLENIIGRYELLTDRKVKVVDEDCFTVKLPVL